MGAIDIFTLEFNTVDSHCNPTAHTNANGTQYAITINPTNQYTLQVTNIDYGDIYSSVIAEQQPMLDELFDAKDWRNFLAIIHYEVLQKEVELLGKSMLNSKAEIGRKASEIIGSYDCSDSSQTRAYIKIAASDALARRNATQDMLLKAEMGLSIARGALGEDFYKVRARYLGFEDMNDDRKDS